VLNAVQLAKTAKPEDLKVAAQIASTIGSQGLGSLVGAYRKFNSTPDQYALALALANARNVLRLDFTGAAFSQTERPEYEFLTGDWMSAQKDPERVRTAMTQLEPYFSSVQKAGENAYQSYIDALMESAGLGSSEWEVVEEKK
jgi:hypothetical protein